MKKIFEKITSAGASIGKFLEGKKRRIATLCGIAVTVTKPYTLVNQVCTWGLYLFGGADAVQNGSKYIKDKLPGGLRK